MADVRDFLGTLTRERAEGGIFICLRRPTKDMVANAASAGFYDHGGRNYPRLQILSIEEWFTDNERPVLPSLAHLPRPSEVRTAGKRERDGSSQTEMMLSFPSEMVDPAGKPHLNPVTAFEPRRSVVLGSVADSTVVSGRFFRFARRLLKHSGRNGVGDVVRPRPRPICCAAAGCSE